MKDVDWRAIKKEAAANRAFTDLQMSPFGENSTASG
jgi:hypothetical protein